MRKTKLYSLLAATLLTTTTAWAGVAVNGKLPGAFSVSATKVVYFSQGNLQYQGSTNSWRFAAHQYDIIGSNAGNTAPSASQTEWIDLFGWATSGNSASGTAYQPYVTGSTSTDFGPSIESGEWTAANSDWGVVNSASLGSGWRTLTKDEWVYLFKTRTNAATLRTFATVNGVTGLILMPDGYDYNHSGLTITTANFTSNTLTTTQWENNYESEGCVFLPAAGYRNNTYVSLVGTHGRYWSSTSKSSMSAYYLLFNADNLRPDNYDSRNNGNSVRLVSEIAPPPSATITATPTAKSLIYNGNAQALVNAGTASGGTMYYSLDNSTWSISIPTATNSGDYTVYYKVVGDASHRDYIPSPNTVAVTIAKADAVVTTAPTAIEGLVYTGVAQTLVNAGSATGGELQYKLDDGTYSTSLPQATAADTYTVYYKVVGDANHNDVAETSFTVTIGGPTNQVLTANQDPNNTSDYYSTFYHSAIQYSLPEGTQAFIATLSGDALNLTKIAEAGEVLPANTAVILKASGSSITLTPSDADPVTFDASNNLLGVDAATAAPANCYVLSGHSSDNSVQGVGFYQYTGTLAAHKAYVVISGGGASAPKRLHFVFNSENTATGFEQVQSNDVQSTKVIENGVLYIIRGDVKYNAQGQIVKWLNRRTQL